jgi:putative ABC transport system permease protein
MQVIPLTNLSLSFLPVVVVVAILFAWQMNGFQSIYAMARMVLQLLMVGYLLVYIFDAESPWIVVLVLCVMLTLASWIALRPLQSRRWELMPRVFVSIAIGSLVTVALVTQAVLHLEPRWNPQFVIPLGGMIFANAMNCVSLAAERYAAEAKNGLSYLEARPIALRAALIPITNSLFSVGIVSLPGMMTGQILDGVSPLIAVRYQIMVMCMVFGSGGISAACYLWSLRDLGAVPSKGSESPL